MGASVVFYNGSNDTDNIVLVLFWFSYNKPGLIQSLNDR